MSDVDEMTGDDIKVYTDRWGRRIKHQIKRLPTEQLYPLIQQSTPMAMDGNSKIFLTEKEMSVMNINYVKKETK